MSGNRKAAVAGLFYPDRRENLSRSVQALLDTAGIPRAPAPKALIVPHAGYVYSGPTAAAGYAQLQRWRDRYERVVLLGPCHRVPVHGIATSGADAFSTPLGEVPLDRATIDALDLPIADAAHRDEHSLEVQLPFLQQVLGRFVLLPIVVGDAEPETVATLLDAVWGGHETLIVVSSDLSHYLGYDEARRRDRATCEAIERYQADGLGHDDACGATPVAGLLLAAERHGLSIRTLDLCNSGDTAGDREHVVGYGAWALS